MTEDFTRADDIQLAAGAAEGEGCPEEGDGAEACAGAGGGNGEAQAQDAVTVVQPPNGAEIILQAAPGEVYDLQFDPRLAEVRVIDVDGDQDLDVVLVFNAGTADESRIVFMDMVDAAQSGNPPALQIGNAQFGADVLVQQAQALTGERPTLETAAPSGQEAEGTGATQYDDNLGTPIDLLDPQGVIPPVEMVFPSLEPTVAQDPLLDTPLVPPVAFSSSVTSIEGELIGIPGSPVTVGGFFYEFDVGEENDISDNIHGTDEEDGVTTAFTITSLPEFGVLVVDRDDDGTLDEVYGVSSAFVPAAQPLPADGLEIDSDDTVFYFLPIEEVLGLGELPGSVTYTYFTTDSDGLESNGATVVIGFPDPADVVFDIMVTSEDAANDTPTQAATIAEEDNGDDLGTYAITLSGDALSGLNFASVTVTVSGDAEDADFTQAVIDAIEAGALTANVGFVDNLDGTVTLTWDVGSDATVNVDLEAVDDDLTDSPETLTLSLSNETVGFGSASVDGAKQTADLTIVDRDADVVFDIMVTSEDAANDTPTQAATIAEEDNGDDLGTYAITLSGDALTGANTASVTVTVGGDAEDADFTQAVIDAIEAGALTANVGFVDNNNGTVSLTWDAGSDATVNVALEAFDDNLLDSPETLTLSLSGAAVDDGSASIDGAKQSADLTIEDSDQVVFDIMVMSEDDTNDTPTQSATVSEEDSGDDTGTFRISATNTLLQGADTASVTVTMSGSAGDADFTQAVIAAIAVEATTEGIAILSQNATSIELEWDAADPSFIDVDLTAFDDEILELAETLTLSLSNPSANATIDLAKQSADLNILFDDEPFAGNPDALVIDETEGVDTDGIEDDVDPTTAFNGLSTDNKDALTTTLGLTAGFVGVLSAAQQNFAFDFGQDGPGSISMDGVTSGTPSGLFDTVTGQQIFLFTEDGLLVGRVGSVGVADAGGDIAFVVIMEETGTASGIDNTSDATITVAQYRAIEHDDTSDPDEANGGTDAPGAAADEFILVDYTVVDVQGDTAGGSATVSFEDDGPEVVTADSSLLGNHQGGDAATEQLNFFETVGADRGSDADVVFVNNELDNKLRGSTDGDPAEVMTSDGHEILLAGFDSGTLQGFVDLNDNGLLDDGAGSLVLQIDLNPDAGDESLDTYTIQLFGMIDNGEALVFNNFGDVDSGGPQEWIALDDPRAGAADLNEDILFTSSPISEKVNTSAKGIGVKNQQVDSGDVIRIDFVSNVNPGLLNDGTPGAAGDIVDLTYDAHYTVNDAGFGISQDFGPATVQVTVFDADNDNVFDGDAGDVADTITSVSVLDDTGNFLIEGAMADTSSGGVGVVFNLDGTVDVSGLLEGYQVLLSTADGFNRIEVEALDSKFDLGGIVVQGAQSGDPIDLSFDLEVTDSDGDTNSGSLDVTLLPQLNGTSDNDTLEGNGDAEILVGGLGDDTLTGGGEADIFVFNLGVDDGDDTITDFTGSEDILRFIDVVDGAGDDIQDVDDMITAIVNDGAGDVQVNLTNGGSIVFGGIAFAAQTSIADLVDNNTQVVVDHM